MYESWVGYNKDVFRTKLFRSVIIFPFILAVLITIGIKTSVPFQDFLTSLWQDLKLPIAIISLSLPLATWVIANHSSSRATISLLQQNERRLLDSYFEQEKHFEKTLGRHISTSGYKYIEKDDISVMIAKIYEYKKLKEKGELSINKDIYKDLEVYIANTKKISSDFYVEFQKAKEEQTEFCYNLSLQLLQYMCDNLNYIASHIGTRVFRHHDAKLDIMFSAYSEIYRIFYEIIPEEQHRTIFSSYEEDDVEVFEAVIRIVSEMFDCKFDNICMDSVVEGHNIKMVIDLATSSPLKIAVNNMMKNISDVMVTMCPNLDVRVSHGDYVSCVAFLDNHESCINIKFSALDEDDCVGVFNIKSANKEITFHMNKIDDKYVLENGDEYKLNLLMKNIKTLVDEYEAEHS